MEAGQKPLFLTLLIFLSSLDSWRCVVESDLGSDRAALVALRNSVGGGSLLWNLSDSPCKWAGVSCSQDRVVELRLPGKGLSGQLPIALGNLTQLQTLSLRFNALSGTIPTDVANLESLSNLFLQDNFFSGEIPGFLFDLHNLVRLDLSHNNFSGVISPDFNKLTGLGTLYLEQNRLTGSIPDLNSPPLDRFNVSFNKLSGPIPPSLSSKPADAFAGNSLCGKPLVSCNGKKNKLSGGAIAGIVIGCVIGVLLILMIVIFLCQRRGSKGGSKPVEEAQQREVEKAGSDSGNMSAAVAKSGAKSVESKNLVFFGKLEKAFDLEELLRAYAEVLGKGTFGTTYKATLEMATVVAVKRLKDVTVTEREFREQIEAVGAVNHENLVHLRAYYYSNHETLLVYDYMPKGSLSALLHGNRGSGKTPLSWETRSGIALGAARGIAYLHRQGPAISHGNIKSSNVLLTKSFEARVSDFGLAQLAGATRTPNRVDGYRAPEVTQTRKLSQKADVYSFGVLLLELLTGKAPTQSPLNDEGVDLPRWVQSVVKDEWNSEVFDLELLRYQNVEEEMVHLLELAVNCTAQHPDNRPSMADVGSRIEKLCQSSVQVLEQQEDIVDDQSSPHAF